MYVVLSSYCMLAHAYACAVSNLFRQLTLSLCFVLDMAAELWHSCYKQGIELLWVIENLQFSTRCPVGAHECYSINLSCFLAEYRKKRLNQGSFVLLYFALFAFSGLSLVF